MMRKNFRYECVRIEDDKDRINRGLTFICFNLFSSGLYPCASVSKILLNRHDRAAFDYFFNQISAELVTDFAVIVGVEN